MSQNFAREIESLISRLQPIRLEVLGAEQHFREELDHVSSGNRQSARNLVHYLSLRRHDILLSCNGTAIRDGEHFVRLVQSSAPDARVPLVVLRGGQEMTLRARLAEPTLGAGEAGLPKGFIRPGGPHAGTCQQRPLRQSPGDDRH